MGRKVQKRRFLQELYETASRSIGLPIPADSPAIETFRLELERYLVLTEQRQHLEAQAANQLSEHHDFKRLQTMPGVGPVIALMILAESGDLRRFPHHRQCLKFCGFDLAAAQSGTRCSKHRLSKRGNARLRYAYWLAATVAIRRPENSFRAKYERYIRPDPNSGDLKRKATTAVAAKLARVAHALVKQESEYRSYCEYAVPGGGTPLSGP